MLYTKKELQMILTGQVPKFRPRPTLGENSQSRHYATQAQAHVRAGAVLGLGEEGGGGGLHEFNRDRAVHRGLNAVSSSTLMCVSTGRSSFLECTCTISDL